MFSTHSLTVLMPVSCYFQKPSCKLQFLVSNATFKVANMVVLDILVMTGHSPKMLIWSLTKVNFPVFLSIAPWHGSTATCSFSQKSHVSVMCFVNWFIKVLLSSIPGVRQHVYIPSPQSTVPWACFQISIAIDHLYKTRISQLTSHSNITWLFERRLEVAVAPCTLCKNWSINKKVKEKYVRPYFTFLTLKRASTSLFSKCCDRPFNTNKTN